MFAHATGEAMSTVTVALKDTFTRPCASSTNYKPGKQGKLNSISHTRRLTIRHDPTASRDLPETAAAEATASIPEASSPGSCPNLTFSPKPQDALQLLGQLRLLPGQEVTFRCAQRVDLHILCSCSLALHGRTDTHLIEQEALDWASCEQEH